MVAMRSVSSSLSWITCCLVALGGCELVEEDPAVRGSEEPADVVLFDDGIEELDDPSFAWECDSVGGSTACSGPYLDVAEARAPQQGLDACVEDLVPWLTRMSEEGDVANEGAGGMSAETLGERVLQRLAIRQEIDALDDRSLVVRSRTRTEHDEYTEQELLLTDDVAGTFLLRLLLPRDVDGPVPALLVMPGHPGPMGPRGQLEEFLDKQEGIDYLRAGYAIAMQEFRAYDSGLAEHLASTRLLCAGLSQTALKNYETLVVRRFLRRLQARDVLSSVALLGHSGGSISGNALVRYAGDRFDAYVTDLFSNYMNVFPCDDTGVGSCVLDETHPGLQSLAWLINDFGRPALRTPHYIEQYGFPDGVGTVLNFLDETL